MLNHTFYRGNSEPHFRGHGAVRMPESVVKVNHPHPSPSTLTLPFVRFKLRKDAKEKNFYSSIVLSPFRRRAPIPRIREIFIYYLVTSSHELIFTRKNQRVSKLLGRVAVITHSLTRYARSGAI
jgi:hypothetical protein